MRELIGQVLGWLRLVRIRPGTADVHGGGRHARGAAVEPQERERLSVGPSAYFPPEPWERSFVLEGEGSPVVRPFVAGLGVQGESR
jgi:hypothetical protein